MASLPSATDTVKKTSVSKHSLSCAGRTALLATSARTPRHAIWHLGFVSSSATNAAISTRSRLARYETPSVVSAGMVVSVNRRGRIDELDHFLLRRAVGKFTITYDQLVAGHMVEGAT
jgi:hypothetical protein